MRVRATPCVIASVLLSLDILDKEPRPREVKCVYLVLLRIPTLGAGILLG